MLICVSELTHQPAQYHDYQPGWTIVGSGLADKTEYRRPMASLIPAHFAHIQGTAAGVEPQSSRVVLADGTTVAYESLVVAAGLQISKLMRSGRN
jgi:NADH dehydrogenase FAD-containing subunit